MSLSAHKADAVEGARNRERIERLADLPENKVCADCPLLGRRAARRASAAVFRARASPR